jgi:hypothetical protein
MRKLFHYFATDGFFLFEKYGCRIIDSLRDHCRYVTIQSQIVRLMFWMEHNLINLDFQSITEDYQSPEYHWYSMGLVRELLTGEIDREFDPLHVDFQAWTVGTPGYADASQFLEKNFPAIEIRFNSVNLAKTKEIMERLKQERVKRAGWG